MNGATAIGINISKNAKIINDFNNRNNKRRGGRNGELALFGGNAMKSGDRQRNIIVWNQTDLTIVPRNSHPRQMNWRFQNHWRPTTTRSMFSNKGI